MKTSPADGTDELALQKRRCGTHHQSAHLRQDICHVLIIGDGHQEHLCARASKLKDLFLRLLERAEDAALARMRVTHESRIAIGPRLGLIQRTPQRDGHRDDQGPVVLRRIQECAYPSNLRRIIATHDAVSQSTVIHDHHGWLSGFHDLLDHSRIYTSVGSQRQVDRGKSESCGKARHMHVLSQRLVRMQHDRKVEQLIHVHSSRPDGVSL